MVGENLCRENSFMSQIFSLLNNFLGTESFAAGNRNLVEIIMLTLALLEGYTRRKVQRERKNW